MQYTNNIRNALLQMQLGTQVRVARTGLEDGWSDGYVVGMGPKFFGVHLIGNGIHLDGFRCMRYEDVTALDTPAPHGEFVDRVLKLRDQPVAKSVPIDLSSPATLIRMAGQEYPVVTLHLESSDPDTCYIGKVLSVNTKHVSIRPINPSGEWLDEVEQYSLADITRVDFGGAYEEALVLVGGEG